jgi:alpha-D-xyloside xylohydrolase
LNRVKTALHRDVDQLGSRGRRRAFGCGIGGSFVAQSDTPVLGFRAADHVLQVEPWGVDSVRVRVARTAIDDIDNALVERPALTEVSVIRNGSASALVNGKLRVDLSATGQLRFSRNTDGAELLSEMPAHFAWPGPRLFSPVGDNVCRLEQRFRAYPDEQIFGLGQHMHGRLNQKGVVLDLVQRNAEVTIPFAVSSRGYGFLWNSPAVGRVEFAENGTRWVSDAARQIDYWLTTGDGPADILANYADATGHTPPLPAWATGLWQSKLRYKTQRELLEVARGYKNRGLPLAVIVADYFHWTRLGEWKFDSTEWPDPRAMVDELASMGTRLMVSVWPSVSTLTTNYDAMKSAGYFIGTEQGSPVHHLFPDRGSDNRMLGVSFYDATNPAARSFVWGAVKAGYYDLGISTFWLDACEPEIYPEQFGNLRFFAGPGREFANMYPREHVRGIYEHLRGEGEEEIVSLVRSAWAGSQRFGAALWSGDIPPTFASLQVQVRAGLNVSMSGIPWWTTDIGGFAGGDPESPEYRELIVRWFQYAVFCPLLRMHGHREPREDFDAGHSGGPNEIWSYGPEAYSVLSEQLLLRERLRPYIDAQMHEVCRTGVPPMRPLFVEFPRDPTCWSVDDEYCFGPDLLVAPVLELGARAREVYLPAGASWTDTATGDSYAGGQVIEVSAPLSRIPVFARAGAAVIDAFATEPR